MRDWPGFSEGTDLRIKASRKMPDGGVRNDQGEVSTSPTDSVAVRLLLTKRHRDLLPASSLIEVSHVLPTDLDLDGLVFQTSS